MTNTPILNDVKVLVAVAAIHKDHTQYLEQVKDTIAESMQGFNYDLFLAEPGCGGWGEVVDGYNQVVNKVLSEDYSYVWFVEADVQVPKHAFQTLISNNIDVAAAVIPYKLIGECYRDLMVAGYFESIENYNPSNLHLQDIEGKRLSGNIYAGTSCFLCRKRVFENGLRFIYEPNGVSYDMRFWKQLRQNHFQVLIDGRVICRDLDCPA